MRKALENKVSSERLGKTKCPAAPSRGDVALQESPKKILLKRDSYARIRLKRILRPALDSPPITIKKDDVFTSSFLHAFNSIKN